jgi:hypothetical protein
MIGSLEFSVGFFQQGLENHEIVPGNFAAFLQISNLEQDGILRFMDFVKGLIGGCNCVDKSILVQKPVKGGDNRSQ